MVAIYGMGQSVGLMHCGQRTSPFAPAAQDEIPQRDCSEQTAREIEQEVRQILDTAYGESKSLLGEHRDQLEKVASVLLEKETLDANSLRELLAQKSESPELAAATRHDPSAAFQAPWTP